MPRSTPKITANVKLPGKSITGQTIADAVKKLAAPYYHEVLTEVTDDYSLHEIGRNSEDPYEDCVVLIDGNNIDLVKEYPIGSIFSVEYRRHEGRKHLAGYPDDVPIKAVREFRDQLQEALSK